MIAKSNLIKKTDFEVKYTLSDEGGIVTLPQDAEKETLEGVLLIMYSFLNVYSKEPEYLFNKFTEICQMIEVVNSLLDVEMDKEKERMI